MDQKTVVVSLARYSKAAARVFAGHRWGRDTRKRANLSRFDREPNTSVAIVIPTDLICLSSSFVRGLLGPSVRLLGNKFSAKYQLIGEGEDTEQETRFRYFQESLERDIAELLSGRGRYRLKGQRERSTTHPGPDSWK